MIKNQKQPLRKCIVCNALKDKKELIRVIRTPEGNIETDPTGKKNGRGAYVCKAPECFGNLEKSKALNRSFSSAIPSSVYEQLSKEMSSLG